MDSNAFKEKQKMFQREAEKNNLKLRETMTFKESKTKNGLSSEVKNSQKKNNYVLKLASDMENQKKNKRQKSSDKVINTKNDKIQTENDIKNNKKEEYTSSKNNINKIKMQMEEFMNKKEKEKIKDKEIINKKEEGNIINNVENLNEIIKENDNYESEKEDELKNEKNEKHELNNINNITENQLDENNEDLINNQNNLLNNENEKNEENYNILYENQEQEEDDNDSYNQKESDNQIIDIKTVKKNDNNINNIKINIDNNIDNNNNSSAKNISLNNNPKLEKRNLSDLDVDDFKDFKEEYYLNRKYDKTNVDKGKLFFKYRYLKHKYTQINETIQRLSVPNYQPYSNIDNDNGRISSDNDPKKNKNNIFLDQRYSHVNPTNNKFSLSNNIYLSFFIKNPSTQCSNSIDKDSELRHYHSQFLKITENSILYFNLKQYEDSFLYLYKNGIIKNLKEFGEFLLVGNGFDKFIIGEFLAKNDLPNDKKEVLKGFVNGIKMKYKEISFLECFRFFMKRFYLPKDANLILEIMNAFCQTYFETNKNNEEFVNIFKSSNSIYLLISTLLAVNTMFTRKDIKNINIIKKEEFISMNKDIQPAFLMNIYDQLKNHPLEIGNENYNENVYKRMSALIKENFSKNSKIRKTINTDINTNNLYINENDSNDENEAFNDYVIVENNNFIENNIDSFNLTKNLYNFGDQDKEILIKIQKFHKFVGNDLKHEREFLVYENYTKLIWGKNVEINKDKGNLHVLLINEINDVYNGIEHSDVLKKYIETYPKEVKEKNHFITIITDKREINLKSDSLKTALLWFKALKSLVLKVKNENILKKKESISEINTKFKLKLEELWKDFILPKWNIYGKYIIKKLQKRKDSKIAQSTSNKTIITIINEIANNTILEYYDFFRFFRIGLPPFCRGTIWRILIGNPCCMTETLYENYLNKIEKVDFNDFDKRYHEDNNSIFNIEYNINQMITDVIKAKDYFKEELLKSKIDQEQIMIKSYNILRVFYLIRNDLTYKRSILPLIYVFLIVEGEEYNAFCDIYNLICNNDIIKFYIDDETYIMKSLDFFNNLVEKKLPKIYKHFKNLEISHDLFFIPWITELFSSTLDLKLLLRIIDLYLIDGEYILYQVGLTILSIQEDDLLDLTISEILNLVKKLPSTYKVKNFLKKMKSYDMIINEYGKWKNENELGTQKLLLFQAIFNDDD